MKIAKPIPTLLGWMKSTRSILAISVVGLVYYALFKGLLEGKDILAIAMLVFSSYFQINRNDRFSDDNV